MANDFRSAVKESFWRFHFERQGASVSSIATYCREHELHESSFYAWRRKIETRGHAPPCLSQETQAAQAADRSRVRSTQSCPTATPCAAPSAHWDHRRSAPGGTACSLPHPNRVGLVALEIVCDEPPHLTSTTQTIPTLEIACPGGVVVRLREEASLEVLQRVIVACDQSHRIAAKVDRETAEEDREARLC